LHCGALDFELKSCTTFHRFQCGFRSNRSIETALLRLIAAKRMGHHYTAILDLKGAYPSVPRAHLMKILRKRLPDQICDEITLFMGDDAIRTIGDSDNAEATLRMGVPEGSPLSPSIFNLYIDELAHRLAKAPKCYAILPANMYADDVALFARNALGLQYLLDICTEWAKEFGMHWATRKGKSCVVIPRDSVTTFTLAGNAIERENSTRYLGIIINYRGIKSADTPERIRKATAKYHTIRNLGITDRMHVRRRIHIFNSFIRPVFDFGIHLAPWREDYDSQSRRIENMAFKHPHNKAGKKAWVRYRNILGYPGLATRRNILASKLYARLKANLEEGIYRSAEEHTLAQWEIEALLSMYALEDLTEPGLKEQTEQEALETKRASNPKTRNPRVCAASNNQRPYLTLPTNLARFATRWYFGQFPHPAKKDQLDDDPSLNYRAIETELQYLLSRPQWSAWQKKRSAELLIIIAKATQEQLGNAEGDLDDEELSSSSSEWEAVTSESGSISSDTTH